MMNMNTLNLSFNASFSNEHEMHLQIVHLAKILNNNSKNKHIEKKISLPIKAIFLHGDLGAGKTTLTRYLVQALPKGHVAEISSPSFTLCNIYPTLPPILHCDLYRCAYAIPEDLWDALDCPQTFIIVEWAQYFPSDALPKEYLDISLKICEEGRLLKATAHGEQAEAVLKEWRAIYEGKQ